MSALAKCASCDREVEVPAGVAEGATACCPLCGGQLPVLAKLAPVSPAPGVGSGPGAPVAGAPAPGAIPVRLVSRAPIVARLAPAPQAAQPTAEPLANGEFAALPQEEPAETMQDCALSADVAREPPLEPFDAEGDHLAEVTPPEAAVDGLTSSTDVLVARAEEADQAIREAITEREQIVAEMEPNEPGAQQAPRPLWVTDFAVRPVDGPREATDQVAVAATLSAAEPAAGGVETAEAAGPEGLAVVEVVTTSGLLEPGAAGGLTPWGEAGDQRTRAEDDSSAGVEEASGDADLLSFIGPGRTSLAARVAAGAAGTAPATPDGDTAAPTIYARFRQRRRQSGVRGLVGVLVSGFLGMALVYYLFNLLGGPRYDFFRFPLPGVRHTYQHLVKYPWLPRFGIEPAGGTSQGAPADDDP